MKKTTKDVLTSDMIERDLFADNKESLRSLPLYFGLSIIFTLLLTPISLLTDTLTYCVLGILVGNAPIAICIAFLVISLVEKRKLSHGEFCVSSRHLRRKKTRHYFRNNHSHTYRYLYFDGFHRKLVDRATYEQAAVGKEYFAVHYKKSKFIKLLYPANAYELRDRSLSPEQNDASHTKNNF